MAAQEITHFLTTTLVPFSLLGLLLALFAAFGTTSSLPGLPLLRTAVLAFVSSPTLQFLSALSKPIQLVAVVHVLRHRITRRHLDLASKISLVGVGMQAFPIVVPWHFGVFVVEWARGAWDADENLRLVAKVWRDYVAFVLILVVLGLEFGTVNGFPFLGKQIDGIIEKSEGGDALEKGVHEKSPEGPEGQRSANLSVLEKC